MRYLQALILAVSLIGCAHARLATPCGVELEGSDEIEKLTQIETVANEYVSARTGHNLCSSLNGWKVIVRPDADKNGAFPWRSEWTDDAGVRHEKTTPVYGLTSCAAKTIELGKDDFRFSAYTHETLHVIECNFGDAEPNEFEECPQDYVPSEATDWLTPPKIPGHACWLTKGYYQTIADVFVHYPDAALDGGKP